MLLRVLVDKIKAVPVRLMEYLAMRDQQITANLEKIYAESLDSDRLLMELVDLAHKQANPTLEDLDYNYEDFIKYGEMFITIREEK